MKKVHIFGSIILTIVVFSSIGLVCAWELDPGPGGNPVKKYAVVVGIRDYKNPCFTNLAGFEASGIYWNSYLDKQSSHSVYDFDDVILLGDDSADPADGFDGIATKSHTRSKVQFIASLADDNDIIAFFFNGHGIGDYMCMWDSTTLTLRYSYAALLLDLAGSQASQILVFSDCCYSGNLITDFNILPLQGKDRFLLITSCGSLQTAGCVSSGGLWSNDFKPYFRDYPTNSLEWMWSQTYNSVPYPLDWVDPEGNQYTMTPRLKDGDTSSSFTIPI